MSVPRLTSPSEQVSLEAPVLRARRLGRLQAALVAPIAMALTAIGCLAMQVPAEDRTWAYVALGAVLVLGGIGIGLVDRWAGQSLMQLLWTGSALRRAASDRAAELARSNGELRRRDRQRTELFATMSHELRTPLNAILGYSQALLDGLDGELSREQRDDVSQIHEGGKILLNVVNGALDLARIEAGTIPIAREPVSASILVEEVVSLLRPLAASKGLKLVVDTPADLLRVFGDEERLRQVLLNLVGNAIKFTDQGSVTVRAVASETHVTISVTDTGPGIPASAHATIFEPFQQVDASVSRRHGGTGLGLAIARRLTELMGGQIGVESKPGAGATFSVTMPVAAGSEAESLRIRLGTQRNGVLVIGEGTGTERLTAALERRMVKTETSEGAGWQRVLADVEPAMVVIDLLRPRAAAWQTLAELRADPDRRELPVALVGMTDEVGSMISPGSLDFLLEPRLEEELVERVEALRAAGQPDPEGPPPTVLVAGADGVWRYRVRRLLQVAGFQTAEAATTDDALAAIREESIELAVLDLLLPERGVVPLVGELRAAEGPSGSRVLVIGPTTLSPAQQRMLYLGTVAWLRERGRPVGQIAGRIKRAVLDQTDGPAREPEPEAEPALERRRVAAGARRLGWREYS